MPGIRKSPGSAFVRQVDGASDALSDAAQQTHLPLPSLRPKKRPLRPRSFTVFSPTVASIPEMRRTSTMSDSDADRKRNKLGYRRISVACTHCRRRKIRCIPAENDTLNRCRTCIRLKKDCVFHPVEFDQDGDIQPQAPGLDGPTGNSSTVSSSSPRSASEDGRDDGLGFSQTNGHGGFQGIPVDPLNTMVAPGDPSRNIEYGYHLRDEARPVWQQVSYGSPVYPASNRPVEPVEWSFNAASVSHDPSLYAGESSRYAQQHYNARSRSQNYPYTPSSSDGWVASVRSTSLGSANPTTPHHVYPSPYGSDSVETYSHADYHPHSLAIQSGPMGTPSNVAEGMQIGMPPYDYPPHTQTNGHHNGWYPQEHPANGDPPAGDVRSIDGEHGRPHYELC